MTTDMTIRESYHRSYCDEENYRRILLGRFAFLACLILTMMIAMGLSSGSAKADDEVVHEIKVVQGSVAGGWNKAELSMGYSKVGDYYANSDSASSKKVWDVKSEMGEGNTFSVTMKGDEILPKWIQFDFNIGGGFTIRHCSGTIHYYCDGNWEGSIDYTVLSAPFTEGYTINHFKVKTRPDGAEYTDNNGKTTRYYNCSAAWNKLSQNGGRMKLMGDWKVSARKAIRKKKAVLDLNGYAVDGCSNGKQKEYADFLSIGEDADFKIIDSSPNRQNSSSEKGGTICNFSKDGGSGGAIHVERRGRLTMEGCTIADCNISGHGGAIGTYELATVVLKGTVFKRCETKNSGSSINGGAIYLYDNSKLEMENCKFYQCKSEDYGGAIHVELVSKLFAKDCEFRECEAKDDGGCIWASPDINGHKDCVRLIDCNFYRCKADNGGALWMGNVWATVDGGDIIGCNAKKHGGGVCIKSPDFRKTTLRNMTIAGCGADSNGGGVYTDGYNPTLYSMLIRNNYAGGQGGGVYVDSSNDINIAGKMIVKDNIKGKGASNFVLQDGNFSEAKFFSGGLIEGSDLRIGSTGSGNVTIGKNMGEKELRKYVSVDNSSKSLELRNTWTVHAPVYATVISEHNSMIIIIAGLGVLIAAAVVLYLRKKRFN